MKQLVTLIMIAFLVPTAAMAANAKPCKEDKAKFCKEVKASGGNVDDCLKQHIGEVSPACKESIAKSEAPSASEKPAEAAKPAEATKPSGPASPGAAETKP